MTDVAHYQQSTALADQMEYARVVSSGSLLPQAYRGKPADILIATGLGQAMGLSPAESLYRIHVIQGRPTASAELIAANVRKAGHKLRVQGDDKTGVLAQIIRSDDPEFTFESKWDMDRARLMGLVGRDSWKSQPGTMMRWRAITEVARLACPEALYGVSYVREEVEDERPTRVTQTTTTDDLTAELIGEVVPTNDGGAPPPEAEGSSVEDTPDAPPSLITAKTRGQLFALFAQKGIDEADQLSGVNHLLKTSYTSRSQITEEDAGFVIDYLKTRPDADADAADDGEGA